jgi:hypothetical protein
MFARVRNLALASPCAAVDDGKVHGLTDQRNTFGLQVRDPEIVNLFPRSFLLRRFSPCRSRLFFISLLSPPTRSLLGGVPHTDIALASITRNAGAGPGKCRDGSNGGRHHAETNT